MYLCRNCNAHIKFEDKVCPFCMRLNKEAEEIREGRRQQEKLEQERESSKQRTRRGYLLTVALGLGSLPGLFVTVPQQHNESSSAYARGGSGFTIPHIISLHALHPVLGPLLVQGVDLLGGPTVTEKYSSESSGVPAYGVPLYESVDF